MVSNISGKLVGHKANVSAKLLKCWEMDVLRSELANVEFLVSLEIAKVYPKEAQIIGGKNQVKVDIVY